MARIVQADREAELLFRGQAYRRAIESYYRANGVYPRALEDLLKDPRFPSKRHIRSLYPDPMGKGQAWLLLRLRAALKTCCLVFPLVRQRIERYCCRQSSFTLSTLALLPVHAERKVDQR